MALLYDHEPFTRANGAHDFGPRNIPDGLTTINIRFGRCTAARPDLWPDVATEIAAQLWVSVDGGPPIGAGGIGYISDDAWELFQTGTTAAQLIAAGKLKFGARGGVMPGRVGDLPESVLRCPLHPGINRVVTGVLGVRGGPFVTELTLEVL